MHTTYATLSSSHERLVYTVAEAGEMLGISRAFAFELVAWGELPVVRLGRRRLVPKAALLTLVGQKPEVVRGLGGCACTTRLPVPWPFVEARAAVEATEPQRHDESAVQGQFLQVNLRATLTPAPESSPGSDANPPILGKVKAH